LNDADRVIELLLNEASSHISQPSNHGLIFQIPSKSFKVFNLTNKNSISPLREDNITGTVEILAGEFVIPSSTPARNLLPHSGLIYYPSRKLPCLLVCEPVVELPHGEPQQLLHARVASAVASSSCGGKPVK
jgi:hypothetical protein